MTTEKPRPGPDEMFCIHCGALTPKSARFCPNCGGQLSQPAQAPRAAPHEARPDRSDRSRVAAGILGILLGWLGVHRFYLGHVGIGIVQIIVTIVTFGFGGLWGFIEGIIILADGNCNDAERKPLRHYNE